MSDLDLRIRKLAYAIRETEMKEGETFAELVARIYKIPSGFYYPHAKLKDVLKMDLHLDVWAGIYQHTWGTSFGEFIFSASREWRLAFKIDSQILVPTEDHVAAHLEAVANRCRRM